MSRNRLGFLHRAGLAFSLALASVSSAFAADDWVNVATISPTSTLVSNSICYTDGRDIACDGSAGLITAPSTSDRIVSSTSNIVVNSNGYISITTLNVNTGYFDTTGKLVVPAVSATGTVAADLVKVRGVPFMVNGSNFGFGGGALDSLAGGANNMAWGSNALNSNLSGSSNIAIGGWALSGLEGSMNVAVGQDAMSIGSFGDNNVALGYRALRSLGSVSTDTSNTAVGSMTGGGFTQGNKNVLLGTDTGRTFSQGDGNILVGYGVDTYATTSSNYLNIGNSLFGTLNTTADGGVALIGINVRQPSVALEVSGTVSATRFVGDGSGLTGVGGTPDAIVSGTTKVTANSTGYISLTTGGTTTGYFDTAGLLVVPGVSATGTVSADLITVRGVPLLVSGSNNIALGTSTGTKVTTGTSNIGIGNNALWLTSTGASNIAIGTNALWRAATGNSNIGIGAYTGRMNTAGSSNVFVGNQAGYGSTSGSGNIFMGADAGKSIASGSSNTLIGTGADVGNVTGYATSNNILIGYGVGLPYTDIVNSPDLALNKLNIGDLIFGDMTPAQNGGLAGKVGINVRLPMANLEVSGTVSATALYVNGVAITGGGASAIDDLSDASTQGTDNVFLGDSSGDLITTAKNNVAVGAGALASATTASYNVANGYGALGSDTTGNQNVAVGYTALLGNTTGTFNTGIGGAALHENTTASYNIGIGPMALYNNSSGQNNVGLGYQALYYANPVSNTVALGYQAGMGANGVTSFQYGTLLGYQAGLNLTTGSYNTLLGAKAGDNLTSGISNIIIGYNIDAPTATSNNMLNIGNSIYGDMVLGMAGKGGAAKIGINWVTPSVALEVSGTISATALYLNGAIIGNVSALDDLTDANSNAVSGTLFLGSGSGNTNTALKSTAVGINALKSVSSGGYNTSVGYAALASDTTGIHNTALGYVALAANTTGQFNVGIGSNALYNNTSGVSNIGIGVNALSNNATGGSNVAIGRESLYGATNVTGTVALGYQAGYGVYGSTAFSYGTLLGYSAGKAITTGSNNTFLGAYAGDLTTTGGNNIIIGYNTDAPTAATNNYLNIGNTIYGDLSTDRVGIGGLSNAEFTVSGTISATALYVNGVAVTGGGGGSIDDLTDAVADAGTFSMFLGATGGGSNSGNYNTGVGLGALVSNTSGSENTAVGTAALQFNTTGHDNVATGGFAMNKNTTGYENVASGINALGNNTTGYYNVGLGSNALDGNVSGTANVAVGAYALFSNTGGHDNVANGLYALYANTGGYDNVALGTSALATNTGGYGNVGIGTEALTAATTGDYNVANGYLAGHAATTGNNNTFLGAYAGDLTTTGGNNIIIGYNTDAPTAATSNYLNIGNTIYGDLSAGRVGIGTLGGSTFTVSGTISTNSLTISSSIPTITMDAYANGGTVGQLYFRTPSTGNGMIMYSGGLIFQDSGNHVDMMITSTGNVGIGITPTVALEVSGTVSATRFVGDGSGLTGIAGGGTSDRIVSGTTSVVAGSGGTVNMSLSGGATAATLVANGLNVSGGAVPMGFSVSNSTSNGGIGAAYGAGNYSNFAAAGDTVLRSLSGNLILTGRSASGGVLFGTGATDSEKMRITSAGLVGIGTSSPSYKLDVNGQVAGAGAYVNTSDARLKKDVTPIAYGLDTVMKLRPVGFNWIDQSADWQKKHQLGLIAQDVEGVVPEVVSVAKDASGTRSLAYSELVPVLIKAVQDLKGENVQLQSENDQLKTDLKAMQDNMSQQNQRLDALEKRMAH